MISKDKSRELTIGSANSFVLNASWLIEIRTELFGFDLLFYFYDERAAHYDTVKQP